MLKSMKVNKWALNLLLVCLGGFCAVPGIYAVTPQTADASPCNLSTRTGPMQGEEGRLQIPPLVHPLKLEQANEIPILLHGYKVFGADLSWSYYAYGYSIPSEGFGSKDITVQFHDDGSAYVNFIPERLGKVQLSISACSGGDTDAWIVSSTVANGKTTCSFTKIKLNAQFVAAVWINGTGVDNDGDTVRNAAIPGLGDTGSCIGQYPPGAVGHTPKLPNGKDGNGNTFVISSSYTGSCGTTLVPDQSVAMPCLSTTTVTSAGKKKTTCPSSILSGVKALSCDEQLNLDSGDHTTASTRTVADKCPACSDTTQFSNVKSPMYGADGHIDAFSSSAKCTGNAVGNLGFFYTSYPTN